MSKYIVRFTPDYTNRAKDVEVEHIQEAQLLLEWFVKHNTHAEILVVETKETIIETSDKMRAPV